MQPKVAGSLAAVLLSGSVVMLGWVGSVRAAPITPIESGVVLWVAAEIGNVNAHQALSDTNSGTLDAVSVSGSATAKSGAAYIVTSGAVSASFDDATHGYVSFVRTGWDTYGVESGVASLCCTTGWFYTFRSDFFGHFHVKGTGNWEGSGTYPLYLQGFDVSPDGLFSPLGECMCFGDDSVYQRPWPYIGLDATFTIRMEQTYDFLIYNHDFTGGGIPRSLGTRSAFSNAEFEWWIEIVRTPEPGTLALLGLGLAGLGFSRRKAA